MSSKRNIKSPRILVPRIFDNKNYRGVYHHFKIMLGIKTIKTVKLRMEFFPLMEKLA